MYEICEFRLQDNRRKLSVGSVRTNPFSNENGAVLLRIRLSSTLQRRKRSPKTEPFENALQNGAIWKRCFLKTLFSRVDGENYAIWNGDVIKIDTTGRQITRPWVLKMADRRCHVASIGHFRVPLCLCFKASPSAKPFLWKWLWFTCKWNCMQNSFSYERFRT